MIRHLEKIRRTVSAMGPVLFYGLLAAGFVLAGYQVWRTALS